MTYLNQTRAAADLGIRARFSALTASLAERFARYRAYRRTMVELDQLSKRELADLGIFDRAQIGSIARDAAYRG